MKSVNTGHQGLDKLIRQTQSKSSYWTDPFLEWVLIFSIMSFFLLYTIINGKNENFGIMLYKIL